MPPQQKAIESTAIMPKVNTSRKTRSTDNLLLCVECLMSNEHPQMPLETVAPDGRGIPLLTGAPMVIRAHLKGEVIRTHSFNPTVLPIVAITMYNGTALCGIHLPEYVRQSRNPYTRPAPYGYHR